MDKILETLLDLNKHLMMDGYLSDYTLVLSNPDFERFVTAFESKYKNMMCYPDMNRAETLRGIKHVKIAGPGSYFHVKRQRP